MTADVLPEPVTAPGVYADMPLDVYHGDPVVGGSLSCSGAKKLLPSSCPAIFDYERRNPPAPKDVFDFGHAAHQLVLGVGPEIVVVDADDWRTAAAKAARDEAHARGAVPLLRDTHAEVLAMAEALQRHPLAVALLGDGGQPETSIFFPDEATGIMRRCRLDWRPSPRDGRTIGIDYKTARSANPDEFGKAAANYGYDMQAAWYLDGLKAVELADDDAQFVFIVQEKTAPYLVSVVQLDATALRIGRIRNREAISIYAECDRTGIWPGYADADVAHVELPYWYTRDYVAF